MDQSLSASGPSAMLSAWYATGFAQFASLAVMLYDIATKIDEEVQHFWKPGYRNATPLYFLTRYTGPVATALCLCAYLVDVNREACASFGWIRSLSGKQANIASIRSLISQLLGYAGVLLTDVVVLLKVVALYGGNKKLNNILAVIIVVQSGVLLSILLLLQIHTNYITRIMSHQALCIRKLDSSLQFWMCAYFIIPNGFSVLSLLLAVRKAGGTWTISGKGGVNSGRNSLISILIRDQFIYIILSMLGSALSVAVIRSTSVVVVILENIFSAILPCIFGSRMLLNLSQAAKQLYVGTRISEEEYEDEISIDTMYFA